MRLLGTVAPSEDRGKVLAAMRGVIGDVECQVVASEGEVRISSDDPRGLLRLHDQLRDRRVRSAGRRLMLARKNDDSTTLLLNRQAAVAGVLVLCANEEESPLGPVVLSITSDDIDGVIQWLTAYEAG